MPDMNFEFGQLAEAQKEHQPRTSKTSPSLYQSQSLPQVQSDNWVKTPESAAAAASDAGQQLRERQEVKPEIISGAKLAARRQFLKMMKTGEAVIANYELPLRPELLYNSRIYGPNAFSTI